MHSNKKSTKGVQMSKSSLADSKSIGTFDGVSADQMYREHILDHYKNPRNHGTINTKTAEHMHDVNPLCGDEIDVYITIKNDQIKNIKFTGKGCAISQASASVLTESIKSKDINDISKMTRDDLQDLLGIEITAMRVKCMMLPLKVIKLIIYK